MLTTNGLSTTNNETVLAKRAKQASLILGALSISERNFALQVIYKILLSKKKEILDANKLDMQVLPLITVLKCRRRWS
jgi:gamma-glutamyl phosphate reductase